MGDIQNQAKQLTREIPAVPAPWLGTKGEAFFSVALMSASKGLSPGTYGRLEANSSVADPEISGEFAGGFGLCMFVRYTQSPVGPYDEVLWAPGYFKVPATGKKRERITNIYVSSVDSVYNGRRNWNIPKQLASFKFHPSDTKFPPYKRIEVSLPDNTDNPFISLDLKPMSLLSRPFLPLSTSYIPLCLDIVIPPPSRKARIGGKMAGWVRMMVNGRQPVLGCLVGEG
ncbi:hypothetical protein MW887_006507 [Aspergillus wentii]|nr:hypothetical protein MW887_006507 [Aspergillus wentii]